MFSAQFKVCVVFLRRKKKKRKEEEEESERMKRWNGLKMDKNRVKRSQDKGAQKGRPGKKQIEKEGGRKRRKEKRKI